MWTLINCLIVYGLGAGLCTLILSSFRLLNWMIVVENLNVLLLFCCMIVGVEDLRVFFISLMVIFTMEVVLGLVVLTRLWDFGGLISFLDW